MGLNISFGGPHREVKKMLGNAGISIGNVVSLNSIGNIEKTNITKLTSPAFGLVIDKISDIEYLVQTSGETPDIFSGLIIGSVYFLNNFSIVSTLPDSSVPHLIQSVGVAVKSTRIRLNFSDPKIRRP